jgi:F-type H+-transporting ATPase subunit a
VSAQPHILLAEGSKQFEAPGLELFNWKPIFHIGSFPVTKPMVLALLVSAIVIGFFYAAFHKPKLVPRGTQNVGEVLYLYVRDEVVRPMMGKEGDSWLRFLVPLFFFIWIGNLMSVVPVAQFPVNSRIAFPAVMAVMVYLVWVIVAIRTQGLVGMFKNTLFPPGLPKPLYVLVVPIEFLSTFIVRPFTHAVRLFANMFAGHILIALFATVGWWFLWEKVTPLGLPVGILGVVLTIVMTAFELFIQALQAYVFTLLAASYIGGALHPEH